ncbi:MAG: hypothetical protein KAY05_06580, partial [Aeromonadaceae bacterium]|nr:hypothetical protein [Aeromonadaceae bacterium]
NDLRISKVDCMTGKSESEPIRMATNGFDMVRRPCVFDLGQSPKASALYVSLIITQLLRTAAF